MGTHDGRPALVVAVSDLDAARRALPRMVADLGLALVRLEPVETTLEEAFVDLVENAR